MEKIHLGVLGKETFINNVFVVLVLQSVSSIDDTFKKRITKVSMYSINDYRLNVKGSKT